MRSASPTDLANIVATCRSVLADADAGTVEVDAEYFYASLPLCVIDSVFSIGVRYESVRNVLDRYCRRFGLPRQSPTRSVPPREEQESVSAFLDRVRGHDASTLAAEIFGNRQRTSSRNGILKAEAVVQFADVLARNRIEHLQDVLEARELSAVERDVRRIPGQSSGISWRYFLMLAGREDLVKPDRVILGFLGRVLGRAASVDEAQSLLAAAARERSGGLLLIRVERDRPHSFQRQFCANVDRQALVLGEYLLDERIGVPQAYAKELRRDVLGHRVLEAAPRDKQSLLRVDVLHDADELIERRAIHGSVAGLHLNADSRAAESQRVRRRESVDPLVRPFAAHMSLVPLRIEDRRHQPCETVTLESALDELRDLIGADSLEVDRALVRLWVIESFAGRIPSSRGRCA